jgi:protein-tyrosine phosphatase
MDIFPGCEVMCVPERMGEICSHIKQAKYPLMGATNYVLAEFPQWVRAENTLSCVEALRSAGYRPILAHMERYKHLTGNMALVEQLRGSGAFLQVNAYSLFEEKDAAIRDWAQRLVTEQKVTFLGTDAHRTYHRPPSAEMGLNWLYENVELEYAEDLAWGNARKRLLCAE